MSQLLSMLLLAASISGCAHTNQHQKQLKPAQVFNTNSGANYIFESKK